MVGPRDSTRHRMVQICWCLSKIILKIARQTLMEPLQGHQRSCNWEMYHLLCFSTGWFQDGYDCLHGISSHSLPIQSWLVSFSWCYIMIQYWYMLKDFLINWSYLKVIVSFNLESVLIVLLTGKVSNWNTWVSNCMVTGVLCLLESDSLSKKLTLVAYSTGWFQEQIENHWISRKTSLTLKLEYLYQTEDKKNIYWTFFTRFEKQFCVQERLKQDSWNYLKCSPVYKLTVWFYHW